MGVGDALVWSAFVCGVPVPAWAADAFVAVVVPLWGGFALDRLGAGLGVGLGMP